MKQQTHDKLNVWRTRKKSVPQMGFEPMTLRFIFNSVTLEVGWLHLDML